MKLLAALVGCLVGVAASVVFAGAFVALTYSCEPGPGEPCDAGGYVAIGLFTVLAPVLGLTFGALGYWLAVRRERRRRSIGLSAGR